MILFKYNITGELASAMYEADKLLGQKGSSKEHLCQV